MSAELTYHEALKDTAPVLDELADQGAPADQVQIVYFAFADARDPDEARRLADTYLGVLTDEVARAHERHPDDEDLPPLMAPIDEARLHTHAAYARWSALLASPRGRLARAFGLIGAPTPGMGVYARPHPRSPAP
ncbi:MAG: hypothetical protein R3F59_22685 [Myxococcota bacterium]